MSTRSLFSPFATSVSPYAARNIGGLFNRDADIEISPEYLALLQSGVEPSEEMMMSTPMFKGGRAARAANAKALESMVQAKFGEGLRQKSEKELIPFRAEQQLEKEKEFGKFKRQQEKEVEEENFSNLGSSIGPQLGNLPIETLNNIIPMGTVLGSPAEQGRMYASAVGEKTPVAKASIEANPEVIRGRVGEEANKRFLKLGGDFAVDTANNSFIQGGSYQPHSTTELVPTNETVPMYDENGRYVGMQKKLVPRSTTSYNYMPGRVGKLTATQADFDRIAKESGANVSTKPHPESIENVGEEALSIPSPLPNLLLGSDNKPTVKGEPFNLIQGFKRAGKSIQSDLERSLGKSSADIFGKMLNPLANKEEPQIKTKERPKSYPFDYMIEAKRLDKQQTEMFENLIESYKKKEKRNPSIEEARAFIQIVIGNRNK